LSQRLFGTDGMRGRAGEEPLTAGTLHRLGLCLASRLKKGVVLLGHDGRESGESLVTSLASGLTAGGLDVDIVGLASTPCTAYLTMAGEYCGGVMVSASHNPADDNGVKLLGATGRKLEAEVESEVEALLVSDQELEEATQKGEQRRSKQLVGEYVSWLRNEAFPELDFGGAKILVDCANGAASQVTPRLLRAFGAEPVLIHDKPNGRNINDGCGALYPEVAAAAIQAEGCALGVSLDGDADRSILVDSQGRVLDGDAILAGLAPHLENETQTVVATVMSNLALENLVSSLGMTFLRTPVGDRNVAKEMRDNGHILGGEKSGHMLFGPEHGFRGDGLYTFLKVAECLWKQGARGPSFETMFKKFAEGYRDLPQELRNLAATRRDSLENLPNLAKEVELVDEWLAGKGRSVVRFSGTELKLRLMVEAENQDLVGESLNRLQAAAQKDGILA